MGTGAPFWIDLCWGLVGVVWVGGALVNAWHGPPLERRAIAWTTWIGSVLAVILVRISAAPKLGIIPATPMFSVGSAGILVTSTAFTLWARFVLGSMWSAQPTIKVGHALKTTGPYAVTRHPIYTGLLGMLLGSALLSRWSGLGILFVVAIPLLMLKAQREEQLMLTRFGDVYERYQRHVPALIPGWRWTFRVQANDSDN